jgi:hypothetical protein
MHLHHSLLKRITIVLGQRLQALHFNIITVVITPCQRKTARIIEHKSCTKKNTKYGDPLKQFF